MPVCSFQRTPCSLTIFSNDFRVDFRRLTLGLSLLTSTLFGGHKAVVRPVPIPNTAVKHSLADGSGCIASARVGCRQIFPSFKTAEAFASALLLYGSGWVDSAFSFGLVAVVASTPAPLGLAPGKPNRFRLQRPRPRRIQAHAAETAVLQELDARQART